MDIDQAKDLIVEFSRNQTDITHAANSPRGVSKRLQREEKQLIARFLSNLTNETLLTEHIIDVQKRIS